MASIVIICPRVTLGHYRDLTRSQSLVSVDWIVECAKKGTELSLDSFLIGTVRPDSGSTESPLPESSDIKRRKIADDIEGSRSPSVPKILASMPKLPYIPKHRDSSPTRFRSSSDSEPDQSIEDNLTFPLADIFDAIADRLQENKKSTDEFRARNYRKAARVLRKYPADDWRHDPKSLLAVPPFSFGPSIIQKVEEFIQTGRIKKFEHLAHDKRMTALAQLTSVFGIGKSTAESWIQKGICTIQHLRSLPPGSLTKSQEIGLRYWEELQQRIPREEIRRILQVVEAEIKAVFGKAVVFEPAGSYRRGADTCGDVDVVICAGFNGTEFEKERAKLLEVVDRLEGSGFITDRLNQASDGYSMFMGICRLDGHALHRRIDLKLWPKEDYPFALLHFTGDSHLNRSMRLAVKREGYKLTDHGLFKNGERIDCSTEKEIFERLGFEYLEPMDRVAENLKRVERV